MRPSVARRATDPPPAPVFTFATRIAMQRYGIPDIRLLYDSDVRFLEQLAG